MGLFTNNKKLCPICGNPTPRLLASAVEGQNLCKECAAKIDLPDGVLNSMTLDEFRKAQARKGESIAGLMLKSVLSSLVEKTGTNRAGEFGLMADFLAGNKTGLKNKLMGMMANAPNGLENTVILEGRNAKCMEVFDRWSGKGVRRIGVFYGAAHLPGLHGALLERGYRLREVRWLPAWSTREQGADGQRGEG